jgi:hypothetical protein
VTRWLKATVPCGCRKLGRGSLTSAYALSAPRTESALGTHKQSRQHTLTIQAVLRNPWSTSTVEYSATTGEARTRCTANRQRNRITAANARITRLPTTTATVWALGLSRSPAKPPTAASAVCHDNEARKAPNENRIP